MTTPRQLPGPRNLSPTRHQAARHQLEQVVGGVHLGRGGALASPWSSPPLPSWSGALQAATWRPAR